MAIEFKEEQIIKTERRIRKPYIGYFSPSGELIDYNVVLGENGHDEWQNPVSWTYLSFVSYIIKNTASSLEILKNIAPENYKNHTYPGIDNYVKRGYGICYDFNFTDMDTFLKSLDCSLNDIKNYDYRDVYSIFTCDLLYFFKSAYSNRNFFDAIGKKICVENKEIIDKTTIKTCMWEVSEQDKQELYREYLIKELMSHFKDIAVQYLGYDSLERFSTNNEEIKIPSYYNSYDSFDFLKNPRIITSSYPNINERYYNYLLMNYKVEQLPRYFFNDKTKKYETHEFFSNYESEKEESLNKEIKAIKRLVPLKDRYKYFR